jgi:hypothetical protein
MSARKNRLRRKRIAWRKFTRRLIAAIDGLTACARSGAAMCEAPARHAPFDGLDADLSAGLDAARHTLDLAREETILRSHLAAEVQP